jgi:hypothetical protein
MVADVIAAIAWALSQLAANTQRLRPGRSRPRPPFAPAGPLRARSTEASRRSAIHCLTHDRDTVMGADHIDARLPA